MPSCVLTPSSHASTRFLAYAQLSLQLKSDIMRLPVFLRLWHSCIARILVAVSLELTSGTGSAAVEATAGTCQRPIDGALTITLPLPVGSLFSALMHGRLF